MKNIFEIEKNTIIDKNNSYITTYPYILEFFASKPSFNIADLICGSHIVYGWMPTILHIQIDNEINSLDIVQTLNDAKNGVKISPDKLSNLSKAINNSVIGASKLLHFISPNDFPIWDSKVYSFIYNKKPHNHNVNNIKNFLEYISILKKYSQNPKFETFHNSVQGKIGYEVSPLRSLELVMFLNGAKYK